MNGKLLLDTNIILGIFRGSPSITRALEAHADADMCVSVLTKMELLSFHSLTPEEEAFIMDLLSDVTIIPLNPDVEETAIRLRRATHRKMPDAIVAASAVVAGAVLVTCDRELAATSFPELITFNPEEAMHGDK
ncbi:MAG: PIN domain-containing protein [Deltaproteobacteria bacterium]|jgi:predicted nucleic acid-binding protein|nr:PIN domain-containing protein [Deltaproteobacteria bacterium]